MSQTFCPDCSGAFSRRDVMIRHRRNKHLSDKVSHAYPQSNEAYPQSSEAYPPSQGVLLQQQQGVIQPQGVIPPPPPPPQADKPPPQTGILPLEHKEENTATVLQHPFTMIISGPTGML